MTVRIPRELEQYIQQKVASGEFESEGEFVSEAMRIYRELEERHKRLRCDVQHGIDQLDRGEGIELNGDDELRRFFDDIKARGRERLQAKKSSS